MSCSPKIPKNDILEVYIDNEYYGLYESEDLSYQGDLFCIYNNLYSKYDCYDYDDIDLKPM